MIIKRKPWKMWIGNLIHGDTSLWFDFLNQLQKELASKRINEIIELEIHLREETSLGPKHINNLQKILPVFYLYPTEYSMKLID